MQFIVVIPARFASSRLPGKPLRDIKSIPMIQHVWQQASVKVALLAWLLPLMISA